MDFRKMMHTVLGLVCTVVYWLCVLVAATTKGPVNKRVTANYTNKSLTEVPKNLSVHINVLILDQNEIQIIENGTFKNLSVLIKLTVNNNKLIILQPSAFDGLDSLQTLELAGNKLNLSVFTPTLFRFIATLRVLDVSRNMNFSDRTSLTHYPDKAFATLINLEDFTIDLAPFPIFGPEFKKMENLQRLEFSHCQVREINNSTFSNFNSSVKYLYLWKCRHFVKVENGTLEPFPHLKVLDISNTYMHPIQAFYLLKPLANSSMEIINFNHVNDESIITNSTYRYEVIITKDLMQYLKTICVEAIDVSNNNIIDFENGSLLTFDRPECLFEISLSKNRFSVFNGHQLNNTIQFFASTSNLWKFEYSYIPLSFINVTEHLDFNMSSIPNDRVITLPSSIKDVEMSHIFRTGEPVLWVIPENTSVRSFDVSFCQTVDQGKILAGSEIDYMDVTGIDSRVIFDTLHLHPLSNLRTLIIEHANLYITSKMQNNIFTFIPRTETLDISHNFLWELNLNIFEHMTKLTYLNLSNNLFRQIPLAITKIPNLKKLDMTNNLLTNINISFQTYFKQLNENHGFTLNLDNNALACDCTNTDFIQWLDKTNVTLDANGTYKCILKNSTEINTHHAALYFNDLYAGCNSKLWLKAVLGVFVAFIVIFFSFMLVYSFRWRISFYLYKRFRNMLEKGIAVNFKYDVFVFYPEGGLSRVKYVLIPKLERKWGLQMCIPDRDFSVGKPIADEIADNIEQSRHIIFLVTSSFKLDLWGEYAIERAKYHHFSQNLQKIIVITKDLETEEIPHELSALWKDIALIEWPMNEKDLENTWNKLKLWLFLNQPNLCLAKLN
ncbi:toll-like receptor 2 [Mytilus galloprovincialis]|uniref:toll-like receptor 2 n=1 Tax=Mytilus galloprovincialis TaxID=29158 RepID=UPI003F7BECBE